MSVSKLGVDDWLVRTGKSIADLMALAEGPRPQPKAAPPLTQVLWDAPNRLSRPLALVEGRAYAATWAWVRITRTEAVNRRGEVVTLDPPQVTVEERLFILRDDGVVFGDGGDQALDALAVTPVLAEVVPPDRRLSPAGMMAYRDGRRPDAVEVFGRLRDCVDRFIDFDRSLADQTTMSEMVACYILATWFLDAFTVAGFLWPNGERGCGKTQLLSVITQLAYLGQLILAGGSFAALRDMADYGATLAFDDAENLGDPRRTDPDKRTLLLAGNRRGNSVPLKEAVKDGWRLRYVNTFSFRLFSAIQLPDPVLASRTIVVPLIRTPDRYRANADPEDASLWPHDRKRLVDDLWLLALANLPWLGAYEKAVNDDAPLTGRNLEPWRALLAVAGWLDGEAGAQGSRGAGEKPLPPASFPPAPLPPRAPASLYGRMCALAQAYQAERANVEASDLTGLVIRALGMLVGKMVRDGGTTGTTGTAGVTQSMRWFLPTTLITSAAQQIAELQEIDINPDRITTTRISRVLKKMRLTNERQSHGGKRGWSVSLEEVDRWAISYGLDSSKVTGIPEIGSIPHKSRDTSGTSGTRGTQGVAASNTLRSGVL